ncbi:WD40 repeat-like protein [Dendrothele bispora CBS 962.96]|uniref:WD40 repeat-like protein n=1 Tax=Dendrothele bispora (strain CBS 962.96) TaxID=1314807 RepID=A0A4S8LEP4_DENBC|nr:WD40 repeat-like protein [Dendrothele bispora CBS 962.96]
MSTLLPEYTLTQRLNGHRGAVNCLVFFRESDLLISGGDDQYIRCWDLQTGECVQELRDARWGQITTLCLLTKVPLLNLSSPVMFIGTGRGYLSMFSFSRRSRVFNAQMSSTELRFDHDDPVEGQAIDEVNGHLAICSHAGRVQVYKIVDSKTLEMKWALNLGQILPISLIFQGDTNDRLCVHSLYDGMARFYEVETSKFIHELGLPGGIGSVTLSQNRHFVAVQNLSSRRFEIYKSTESSHPAMSFSVSAQNRMIKQSAFGEEQCRALTLEHDDDCSNIYCVATDSSSDEHVIASGETEGRSKICIWVKLTDRRFAEDQAKKAELLLLEAQAAKDAEAARQAAIAQKLQDERLAEIEANQQRILEASQSQDSWTQYVILLLLIAAFFIPWKSAYSAFCDLAGMFLSTKIFGSIKIQED